MPLVTDRNAVLDIYAGAAECGWVIPAFCSENLTTTEAVLAAALETGRRVGREDLPITLALTNLYSHRSQSVYYTHTRRWEIGLKLFMADLKVLTDAGSPFEKLKVMAHLDHIQHDLDHELLGWDMAPFSSIMFDASALPFEENIAATARFVAARGKEIVIEGACDEIVDATGEEVSAMTTPEKAEAYFSRTGVDMAVANLGTEHRASTAELQYRGDLARQIKARVGARIVLHGCSSVTADQIGTLFEDGICKVNIWTALERESAPPLLESMVKNAAKVAGAGRARRWNEAGLLGPKADLSSPPALSHYTTAYRQEIVFEEMKRVVAEYLGLWFK
jgi:fructose/tagatose bisphosphate aldolase